VKLANVVMIHTIVKLERWQMRQKVVAHKERQKDKVVNHALQAQRLADRVVLMMMMMMMMKKKKKKKRTKGLQRRKK
jgi:hypothetical protein